LLQGLLDVLDHLGGVLVQYGIMLDDDQTVTSLFEDDHKLEGGETSSNLQLREPPMQPTQYARKVSGDVENLVSL